MILIELKEVLNLSTRSKDNSLSQDQAELELVCPWCHIHSISAVVNHGALRLKCSECRMDAFVTRIPRDKNLSDYKSRRTIL